MSPAEYVIHVFKGVRKTARVLGYDPTAISKWRVPKERKGCGGEVPRSAQKKILEKAREMNLDITAEDLIFGREIEAEA
jgi:hypothetical protein